jgi:NADPH:quinone reductase-like Zn-dependent oxidoreductase
MPRPGTGGYAGHVCIPATHLIPVVPPDEIPPAHAVALGLNYVTAYQLLERIAPPQEGGASWCTAPRAVSARRCCSWPAGGGCG